MVGIPKAVEGVPSRLSRAQWLLLVEQLCALPAGDFESAVMAVRMRRRKRLQEDGRTGGRYGAPTE